MDANEVLQWMAWGYLAISAFQALPRVRVDKGQHLGLIIGLAALCVAAGILLPTACGWIQTVLVFAFLLLPALLVRRVMTVLGRQRWRTARALLAVASVLLPLPTQRRLIDSLRTIIAIERGELAPEAALPSSGSRSAEDPVRLFRMAFACRWRELDLELGHEVKDVDDPSTTLLRMKIAYEVGAFDEALTALTRLERLGGPDAARALDAGRLLLLIAAGDGEAATTIAERIHQHADYRSYLCAVCAWIGGAQEQSIAALTALAEHAIPRVRYLARYRLEHPPPASASLPSAWRERARLLTSDPHAMVRRSTTPRMVLAVIGVNIAIYAWSVLQFQHLVAGRQLPESLQDKYWDQVLRAMGALIPPTSPAQSWRLAAATVLHISLLHLGMNMVNLYLIGRILEVRLGPWRMLTLILVSGIGGNLVFDTIMTLNGNPEGGIAVGASGGVMGMVGALGAMAARAMRAGLPGAGSFMQVIVLTVVIQVMFDQSHPQVAGTAHLGGLAIGAICGWFLLESAARAAKARNALGPG